MTLPIAYGEAIGIPPWPRRAWSWACDVTIDKPLADLRDRVKGYAIALIKASVGVRGRPVGPVRPPLVAHFADHEAELREIITRGLSLLSREDTKEER